MAKSAGFPPCDGHRKPSSRIRSGAVFSELKIFEHRCFAMAGAGKVHAPIRQHDPVVGAKHKRIIGGFNRCAAHFFIAIVRWYLPLISPILSRKTPEARNCSMPPALGEAPFGRWAVSRLVVLSCD